MGAGVVVRIVVGSSDSRRWRVLGVEASSTQESPSPGPEKDDLRQLWGCSSVPHSSFANLWMKSRDRLAPSETASTLRKSVR